jgi:hypothetical protein
MTMDMWDPIVLNKLSSNHIIILIIEELEKQLQVIKPNRYNNRIEEDKVDGLYTHLICLYVVLSYRTDNGCKINHD